MSFRLQLKLILWKNFIIRKRQKVRVFLELLWPLFLFLILMWVRTRGLRSNVGECHYTEKALPSTGFLPFLQSFICTFNNTCHNSYDDSLVKTGDMTIESFFKLIKDLEELFNSTNKVDSSSLRNRKKFSSSTSSLEDFSSIIKAVSEQSRVFNDTVVIKDNLNGIESLYKEIIQRNVKIDPQVFDRLTKLELNLGKFKPSHLGLFGDNPKNTFCDEIAMKDLVNESDYRFLKKILCALSDEEALIVQNTFLKHTSFSSSKKEIEYFVNRGLGKNISWTEWLSLKRTFKDFENSLPDLETFSTTSDNPSNINQRFHKMMMADEKNNQSKVEEAMKLINTFFCGNTSQEAIAKMFSVGGNATRFDSLQDQFRDRTKIKYQYDNETSPACNKVYKKIEENPGLSVIWRIMKPFLVGKILYTPVTNVTTKIMERVNTSFYVFSVLKTYGSLVPFGGRESKELLTHIPTEDILQIKEFLNSTQGKKLIHEVLNEDEGSEQKIERSQKILTNLYLKATSQEKNKNTFDETIITQLLECIESNKIEAINDQSAAEQRGMKLIEFNKLWALIEFISPGEEVLNPLTTYKIRMNTERVDNTEFIQDLLLRPGPRMRPAIDMKYITFGFAYLQDMIDHAIITEQSGREDVPGVIFQQFPYPCYIDDEFIMAISRTFPLFMVLSWVYTCSMIVKAIVYEKEQRLKETMRVMGLGNGIHWVGWFVDSLIPMAFTIFLLTIILVYGNVLRNSNPVIVYLFLFCYSLATISQSFLISVFFSRANLAAASAGIIFFVLYLPYPFLVRWMFYLTWVHKLIMSLSSNVAFGIGASYLALYEEKGTGIQWKHLKSSPYYDDDFSLACVLYMLLADCAIYMILTLYIEAVFPGQYGIPKSWYFPFTRSYWSGKETTKVFVSPADDILNENYLEGDNFETEPRELKKGVVIKNLIKQYSNGKVAVNGISLNFYEGQITSFLGHNGAGKTTTISILTGLFPPTSGTAFINGHDIRKDMDRIRKSLGMCPQHNVLFNRLTVEEHLWFYGSLRAGNTSEEVIQVEVDQMIYDLGLPHKRNALSTALSGGMQRKLSIAVAFIGGSKVVILDEPTSGVDPFSRRSIWELLLKYKRNRTVILTTHYMDEADLLGDRIAIIANGNLQCCGSSIFLKNRYGSGYHLTVELPTHGKKIPPTTQFDLNGDISGVDDTAVAGLTKYISSIVSSVIFVEHIGTEASYILPERENTAALVKLCDSLDKDKETLGILSYGISDTSLEEIFLRVAESDPANLFESNNNNNENTSCWDRCFRRKKAIEKSKLKENSSESASRHSSVPIVDDLENSKKRPENKYWRQFFALHTKKFHHTKRNRKALFSELILPAIFVCMSLAVSSIFPKLRERPPLTLDPWSYPPPRYMFYSEDTSDAWMSNYIANMKGPEGIGAKCITINGSRDEYCSSSKPIPTDRSRFQLSKSYTSERCSCESGAQICPDGIGEPPPPSDILAAGDIMYDLTNSNISDWIVNTWPKYEEHRYGGFSFGSPLVVPSLGIRDVIYQFYALQQPGFADYIKALYPNRTNSSVNTVKVWYNNKGWLSSVGYMNAINNVLLRSSLPSEKASERSTYGIVTINHPMNFTSKQLSIELIRQGGVTLLHAISVIFALSFVPASFTLYIIEERVSHSKHLQLVSGVNKIIYWVQTFSWDLMAYLVSALLCVFIFLAFNEQAYVSSDNLPGLLLLFLLYGWSCIPLMYPISFLFSVPSSAFVGLSCANMFVGVITTVTTFVLAAFDDEELKAIDDIIKEVFLVFPHFCLGDGLMKLATNHLAKASLMNLDIEFESNVFEWHFLGKNLLCMFAFGVLFFLITLGIEFELFNHVKVNTQIVEDSKMEDESDVAAEKRRIALGQTAADILVINDLSKVYNWSNVPSVNHISVGVKPGECFGLLGLNGAGKTTTFKMLTGAIRPTAGDATIMNYSIVRDINKVRALLGYCPQFDALDPLLTPYEHLVLYARIRNVPSDILHKRVNVCLQRMGLGYYSNKLARTLSGGNRRKLSTAIALIGNPPLIYLDEPTSGMDPKARRFLWSCIQEIVKEGGCVILTSHSMEECQALCTRLTVMVAGTFKCLGSSQHLKMKYGSGYRIIIRCKEENLLSVKDNVAIALPSVKLIEEHYNQLRYEVSGIRLSHVFEEMEKFKKSSLILDYSLSQTTLEEVFLRFANLQSDEPFERSGRGTFVKQCLSCCSGKP